MNEILPLRDISVWHNLLGLLPVPLFESTSDGQFVLLNGSQGNFCLDTRSNEQADKQMARELCLVSKCWALCIYTRR